LKNPTFASPELCELRLGITGNRRFSGSCTASATVRGPFRCAQEDYLKRFRTRTTSFTLSCRFCPARRRRAAFRQKIRNKTRKKSQKVKVKQKRGGCGQNRIKIHLKNTLFSRLFLLIFTGDFNLLYIPSLIIFLRFSTFYAGPPDKLADASDIYL